MVSAPKGLPVEISKKLEDTFTQIINSDEFKTMLKQNYLPYEYKDSKRLAMDLNLEAKWYRDYLKTLGVSNKE
jgi:tripartite-type tricarboxylate transporter receptor subunit TctC